MTFAVAQLRGFLALVAERDADTVAMDWQGRARRSDLAAEVAAAGFDLMVLLALARLRGLSAEQQDLLFAYRLALSRPSSQEGPFRDQ